MEVSNLVNEQKFLYGNTGSAIRELFEYGRKRKAEIGAENVFDYSLGNPSIPAPKIVKETLIKLLIEKEPTALHGYTSGIGDANVREAIANYVNKQHGCEERADHIYLTCGTAAALTISMHAIINRGDEIVALAPFFPEYRPFCESAGGKLRVAMCNKNDFQIDFDALEKEINPKTKAIIINSPNNPTGVVLNEENIIKLGKLLESKEQEFNSTIFIIADEPYRELVYDEKTVVPFIPKFYKNTIVCYSFSKCVSMPGERIGYILVSKNCKESVRVYKAICGAGRCNGYVCAPALFQYLIPVILGHTSDLTIYKKNRDMLYNSLTQMGYEMPFPDGAFYLWIKALEEDAIKFSEHAKKFELLLVPSDSFGMPGYIRIAYCQDPKMIEKSLLAFKALIEDYKKSK